MAGLVPAIYTSGRSSLSEEFGKERDVAALGDRGLLARHAAVLDHHDLDGRDFARP